MALQGSLADIALPDVIQLVSVSGKTGVFTLSGDGADGKIFIKDGQITDAVAGKLGGEYAVYEMAGWHKGQFIFTAGIESERVTVNKSNTSLMMEAARRLDEWRVLQRKIASMDLVPYFLPREPGQDQITLSPQEWAIVTKIDGQLSIAKLEDVTGLPAFDVCKVLYGLVASGLIALRSTEEKPAQAAPVGAVAALAARARRERAQAGGRERRAVGLDRGREAVPRRPRRDRGRRRHELRSEPRGPARARDLAPRGRRQGRRVPAQGHSAPLLAPRRSGFLRQGCEADGGAGGSRRGAGGGKGREQPARDRRGRGASPWSAILQPLQRAGAQRASGGAEQRPRRSGRAGGCRPRARRSAA